MDSAELKFLTRGLYIEPDPEAGPRFRTAAARLDGVEYDTEAQRVAAADAARLLVGLALGGAADELGELLVPDPAVSDNKWTVACYEMGGLTPVAVRDFRDPIEAVVTVSACPDDAHVAAELVASNEHGLRWTAVWRTDDHVSFQLPTTDTAEAGEEDDDDDEDNGTSNELLGALRRWQARLVEWSGGEATPDPVPNTEKPESGQLPAVPAVAASRISADRLNALEQRLGGIESTLGELSAELQAFVIESERQDDASSAAVEQAIDVRFQVLAKVVQASVDRLSAQLVEDRQQTRTMLKGIRADLAPLTKEVIERISLIESRTRDDDDGQKFNVIGMRSSSA